ncbi:MAG: flagellar hook-basal body complex protein FliE [Paraglaciecola sp.]|jgi:flagellar hook-basal body complex protein FliE
MDIKAQSLFQDMQNMASQSRVGVGEIGMGGLPNAPINPSGQDFAALLGNAIEKVNSMQLESKDQAMRFEMGDKSLSLADVMITKEKSGIAFEATVQVRNKVLDAYKQIMNMPV